MANSKDWREFVLLLIDVQQDFWNEDREKAFPKFRSNIVKLLKFCRSSGLDIVHIRAEFEPDGTNWMVPYRIKGETPCVRGTQGIVVLPCAIENTGETLITKQTFDAFFQNDLLDYLQCASKSFVLVAGLETSVCILFTAVSAVQHGYLVAAVEDCCADEPDNHRAVMAGYPFVFDYTSLDTLQSDHDRWLAMLGKLNRSGD